MSWWMTGYTATTASRQNAATGNVTAVCPDLLRYERIGEADTLRGRVVRGFFWLLRAWPK